MESIDIYSSKTSMTGSVENGSSINASVNHSKNDHQENTWQNKIKSLNEQIMKIKHERFALKNDVKSKYTKRLPNYRPYEEIRRRHYRSEIIYKQTKLCHPNLEFVLAEITMSPYMTNPNDKYPSTAVQGIERVRELRQQGLKYKDIPSDQLPFKIDEVKDIFVNEVMKAQEFMKSDEYAPKHTLSIMSAPSTFRKSPDRAKSRGGYSTSQSNPATDSLIGESFTESFQSFTSKKKSPTKKPGRLRQQVIAAREEITKKDDLKVTFLTENLSYANESMIERNSIDADIVNENAMNSAVVENDSNPISVDVRDDGDNQSLSNPQSSETNEYVDDYQNTNRELIVKEQDSNINSIIDISPVYDDDFDELNEFHETSETKDDPQGDDVSSPQTTIERTNSNELQQNDPHEDLLTSNARDLKTDIDQTVCIDNSNDRQETIVKERASISFVIDNSNDDPNDYYDDAIEPENSYEDSKRSDMSISGTIPRLNPDTSTDDITVATIMTVAWKRAENMKNTSISNISMVSNDSTVVDYINSKSSNVSVSELLKEDSRQLNIRSALTDNHIAGVSNCISSESSISSFDDFMIGSSMGETELVRTSINTVPHRKRSSITDSIDEGYEQVFDDISEGANEKEVAKDDVAHDDINNEDDKVNVSSIHDDALLSNISEKNNKESLNCVNNDNDIHLAMSSELNTEMIINETKPDQLPDTLQSPLSDYSDDSFLTMDSLMIQPHHASANNMNNEDNQSNLNEQVSEQSPTRDSQSICNSINSPVKRSLSKQSIKETANQQSLQSSPRARGYRREYSNSSFISKSSASYGRLDDSMSESQGTYSSFDSASKGPSIKRSSSKKIS